MSEQAQSSRIRRGESEPPVTRVAAEASAGPLIVQRTGVPSAVGVGGLQRSAGNQAVSSFLSVRRQVAKKATSTRKAKTGTELKADFVTEQVAKGRFADLSTPVPEGEEGPPAPGGAFWMLNGLNPAEMLEVLRICGKDVRSKLLARIAEADGRFDRPRVESALRSSSWGEKKAGTMGLEAMDAIRDAKGGSFAGVWALLAGKPRVKIIETLRTLPRDMLTQLKGKLGDAPRSDVGKLTEVIDDLLGTGTDMQASDVIDVEGLKGLDRVMASIYNMRGQLIEEKARELGVSTHAAAGIMKVESGGVTFSAATDKTMVRFENHVFWKEWGSANAATFNDHFDFDRSTGGKPWEGHRFRDDPNKPWENCHQSQEQEWRVMEFAAVLSGKEPAYRSASWGAGQIMGSNAKSIGYASAVDMAEAFKKAERPQVTGIFEYIKKAGLVDAVRKDDYLTVAKGYNGKGQAPTYAAWIKDAADAYKRVTAAKKHVIP